jgi:hypothetical protein
VSVLNALNDADEARQRGYNTDPDAMLNLFKEATDLNQRLSKHNDDRRINRPRSTTDPADFHTIFVLLMASRALRNSIQVELSYQSKTKWPFIRAVRAEYESILRFADDELHPLSSS